MSLQIKQKCDVCGNERTLEEYASDPTAHRYTGGWKKWDRDKADICGFCIHSFSEWVKEKRKPKDPGPMPEFSKAPTKHKIILGNGRENDCLCPYFTEDHSSADLHIALLEGDSHER